MINGHASVASDGNKYTYIHSTSDHEFLPNGTRRGPRDLLVDHVLVRWSPPGQTTATMPYDAFQHERTAITDQAAYSKAHLPATTQTHCNTLAQLQNVGVAGARGIPRVQRRLRRSPQRLRRHGATRSHRVPLLETLLTVLLNPPPSVICAANSSSVLCGWWREPPGLRGREQLE